MLPRCSSSSMRDGPAPIKTQKLAFPLNREGIHSDSENKVAAQVMVSFPLEMKNQRVALNYFKITRK